MSEYWKSTPKHHCKFCHCWIADNKPSRDYHEKGKKHQQNVQAKISEVHKKTRDDAKKKAETNSYMKEMERKALAAVKKDLERDPSLAALYGDTVTEKIIPQFGPANNPSRVPPKHAEYTPKQAKYTPPAATTIPAVTTPTATVTTREEYEQKPEKSQDTDYSAPNYWDEDTSPEGYTYYWNTVTGESRWVPPEGYIPRSERNKITENKEDTAKSDGEKVESTEQETEEVEDKREIIEDSRGTKRKLEDNAEVSQDAASSAPPSADIADIPLPGVVPDPEPEQPESQPESKPESKPEIRSVPRGPKHSAYSAWETTKEPEPEPDVDLQLPKTNVVEEKMLTVYEEPKMKFREKTVSSLSKDNLPAVFKKKKKGIGYKNLKARTDDL